MSQQNTVLVSILDKEYQVACPPEQEDQLLGSAKYLDKRMRDIRDTGKVIGLERIAVMAALNISHELLQQVEEEIPEASPSDIDPGNVTHLQHKIDEALHQLRQLEIR